MNAPPRAPQPDAAPPRPPKSPVGRAWIWAGLAVMLCSQFLRYLFLGLSYTQWQASPWYVPAQVGFWAGWLLFAIGAVIRWRKVTRPWLATLPEEARRRRYRRMVTVAVAVAAIGTIPLLLFLFTSSSH